MAGNDPWAAFNPQGGGAVIRNTRLPAQVQGDILENRKKAQDIALDPRRVAVSEASLRLAQQNAAREAANQATTQAQLRQQAQKALMAKAAPYKALDNQLRRVWDLYAAGPAKTKGLAGLADYLPSTAYGDLDAATAGLGDMAVAAFKVPGAGAQSDADAARLARANEPSRWDFDGRFEGKLKNIETRLAEQFKALGMPYTPYRPKGMGAPASSDGPKVIRFDAKGNRIP